MSGSALVDVDDQIAGLILGRDGDEVKIDMARRKFSSFF